VTRPYALSLSGNTFVTWAAKLVKNCNWSGICKISHTITGRTPNVTEVDNTKLTRKIDCACLRHISTSGF